MATFRDVGFIFKIFEDETTYLDWDIRKVDNRDVYWLRTTNYAFMVQISDVKRMPQVTGFEFSRVAGDIYRILYLDKNNRQINRQEAIDIISIISSELHDCGAKHVYFSYINNETEEIVDFEKYLL